MRSLKIAFAASAAAMLAVSAADARPAFSGNRVGGEATTKADADASLIETLAALLGFTATVKATTVAGTESPRSAAPRTEQCEEEKKRAEAAKASQSRRTADAEKRQRGGEPVYLAF